MLIRIKKLAKNRDGISGTVSVLFGIVLSAFIIIAGINVCHALSEYSLLNDFANQLVQTAADEGTTSSDKLDKRYQELCDSCGITPTTYKFSADYYNTSQKTVQYGDTINLEMTLDTDMDLFELPLHFKIKKSAKSQQYWK